MKSVDKFINFVKSDGACEEGTSIGDTRQVSFMIIFRFFLTVRVAEYPLLKEPMIRRMGEYMSRSYIGNGWVVNFADASAQGGG